MQLLLDNIAATIVFGFITLSILTFLWTTTGALNQNLMNLVEQQDMVHVVKLIDRDFRRMGYRKSAPKLIPGLVDSTQVKFYSDIDNNGLVDSVHYFLGGTGELAATPNPNDRILYRQFNTDTAAAVLPGVTGLSLVYVDTAGINIPYTNLITAAGINSIRAVQLTLEIQTGMKDDSTYAGSSWQRTFSPVNLRN